MRRRQILEAALGAYILFIFTIAVCCFPTPNPVPNIVPFRSIIGDWKTGGWPFIVDFIGNIVAFVPMGFVPPLIRRRSIRAWQVALFGVSLSLAIELAQYIGGQRTSDIDDLILNTAGTMVGYSWYSVWSRGNRTCDDLATSGSSP
jgi:glycopeptide antibiotics resistance protein